MQHREPKTQRRSQRRPQTVGERLKVTDARFCCTGSLLGGLCVSVMKPSAGLRPKLQGSLTQSRQDTKEMTPEVLRKQGASPVSPPRTHRDRATAVGWTPSSVFLFHRPITPIVNGSRVIGDCGLDADHRARGLTFCLVKGRRFFYAVLHVAPRTNDKRAGARSGLSEWEEVEMGAEAWESREERDGGRQQEMTVPWYCHVVASSPPAC